MLAIELQKCTLDVAATRLVLVELHIVIYFYSKVIGYLIDLAWQNHISQEEILRLKTMILIT